MEAYATRPGHGIFRHPAAVLHRLIADMVAPQVAAADASVPAEPAPFHFLRIGGLFRQRQPLFRHHLIGAAGRAAHMVLSYLVTLRECQQYGGLFAADGLRHAQDFPLVAIASGSLDEFRHGHALAGNLLVQGFFVQKQILDGNGGSLSRRHGAGQKKAGAVMERDVGRAHLAQLPADGRGSLEQGQKLGRHDLADGVVVLHGKHTRAGTHIHTVGDGAVKDGGLASLGRAADVRFFHLGIAPRIHDPRKVWIHIKAEAAARVGAVLHDDVFRSPYRKGGVGTAAEDVLLAGGEAKGVHVLFLKFFIQVKKRTGGGQICSGQTDDFIEKKLYNVRIFFVFHELLCDILSHGKSNIAVLQSTHNKRQLFFKRGVGSFHSCSSESSLFSF